MYTLRSASATISFVCNPADNLSRRPSFASSMKESDHNSKCHFWSYRIGFYRMTPLNKPGKLSLYFSMKHPGSVNELLPMSLILIIQFGSKKFNVNSNFNQIDLIHQKLTNIVSSVRNADNQIVAVYCVQNIKY